MFVVYFALALTATTTVMAVTDQGSPITLPLSDAPGPSMSTAAHEDQIAEVLFILDKFGVFDKSTMSWLR